MNEPKSSRRVRVSTIPESVRERVRRAYADGVPVKAMRERFGLSETTLRRVIREAV